MATRLGNHVPFKKSLSTGAGVPHRRVPFGHQTIGGKAGEIIRISVDDIFQTFINGDVFAQSTGGSVKIKRTMVDIELALDPAQDASVLWVDEVTVTDGPITKLSIGTAYRIEFVGNAVLYIAGV